MLIGSLKFVGVKFSLGGLLIPSTIVDCFIQCLTNDKRCLKVWFNTKKPTTSSDLWSVVKYHILIRSRCAVLLIYLLPPYKIMLSINMFNCFRIRWNDPRLRRFNGSLKISLPCQIQNTRKRHNTDTNKCLWRHLTRDEPETVSTNESAGKVTPNQSKALKLTNRSSLSMAKPETLVSSEDLLWILYLCLFCSSFKKIDKKKSLFGTQID